VIETMGKSRLETFSDGAVAIVITIMVLAVVLASAVAAVEPLDPRLGWWREARFGMFIHWGLYAVPAGEWNGRSDHGEWIRTSAEIPLGEYDGLRSDFAAPDFDADVWARLARSAGMQYLVITTKHHDGFCLFDSRETDFDVMATPLRRDVMREVADACRREGIRIGWYHSIMDWHHPDYLPRRDWEQDRPTEGADFERYVAYLKAQLRELLTNYGPIDVLWFDGEWEGTWNNARGRDLYDYVRSLQPGIIVNNRVGRDLGDYRTPEQQIPAQGLPGDWETCLTMNDHWGYNRADKGFKSTAELVRTLVDIASKGGNLLLNVGPDAAGSIPPESVERLEAMGRWMKVNGASIHGTTAGPFPPLPWGRATLRTLDDGATRLYLHVFAWPADGELVVPDLLSTPRRASLLAAAAACPLATTRRGDALVVQLPAAPLDSLDTVVVLELAGRPDVAVVPIIAAETPIFTGTLAVQITSPQDDVVLRYTTDGTAPTPASPAAADPVELRETATVTARAFRQDRAVSPAASATFTRVVPRSAVAVLDARPGLHFTCVEGEFAVLPDFDLVVAAADSVTSRFELTGRAREDRFACRWRGFVEVPADGAYRFFVRSDDGSRLWIGETLIVDNDGLHSSREEAGVIALAAGRHPLTVAMFEATGGFDLEVSWSGPGLSKQPVPAAALSHVVE
jgi:alpha-L-fucosidase